MPWFYKVTNTDGRSKLIGPFDSESLAQDEADQRGTDFPDLTVEAPYEGAENEKEQFPRPTTNVLNGEDYVELWTDGTQFPVT